MQMMNEKILVVEDEASLRMILKMQLERAGYKVDTAADGLDGLEKVKGNPPDLVLLDVMMPRMDGSEVCRQLKANFLTSQIPVIMLTALGEVREKVAGLEVGANDYMTKPYSTEELISRIRNILKFSRLQREANPLTGLPGNVAIEAEATRRIQSGEPFAFLYLDIDHFKAFNDYYSYQQGDEAIRKTGRIILSAVEYIGGSADFVGHVGGDDFVVFSTPEHARAIASEVVRQFDAKMSEFYSEQDRRRGYIEVKNRQNVMTQVPLMSITIAGVTSIGRTITHVGQLSDTAAQLKRHGKSMNGSQIVWERRVD
jgi:diguanylate cyclase (GGDEF)-like protein